MAGQSSPVVVVVDIPGQTCAINATSGLLLQAETVLYSLQMAVKSSPTGTVGLHDPVEQYLLAQTANVGQAAKAAGQSSACEVVELAHCEQSSFAAS